VPYNLISPIVHRLCENFTQSFLILFEENDK
jgi:hypothetical protein